jgi:hypothetical protein
MPHSHYVMDLYFREDEQSDRYRREVLRIEAGDDEAAVAEGERIDGWRQTGYYTVRAIQTSSRTNDRVIYSSRIEDPPVADESAQTIALQP